MRTILAILAFIPLSLLRWTGMFLSQKEESLGESFIIMWKSLRGHQDEVEGSEGSKKEGEEGP